MLSINPAIWAISVVVTGVKEKKFTKTIKLEILQKLKELKTRNE
jgi:hypothetical protein